MEIIPESSLKDVLQLDIELKNIFEDIGVNIDKHINSSLTEIAQSRVIPVKILIEDIHYVQTLSKRF